MCQHGMLVCTHIMNARSPPQYVPYVLGNTSPFHGCTRRRIYLVKACCLQPGCMIGLSSAFSESLTRGRASRLRRVRVRWLHAAALTSTIANCSVKQALILVAAFRFAVIKEAIIVLNVVFGILAIWQLHMVQLSEVGLLWI